MPLFIPTSKGVASPLAAMHLTKGQLYNLDTNEFISFQFNPSEFEWERMINWSEISWQGDTSGGDLAFINVGPRTYNLDLLYMADPGAPEIESKIDDPPYAYNAKNDFQRIRKTIEKWEADIEGKGRPSAINLIMGSRDADGNLTSGNSFEGVIVRSGFRLTEFFNDLSVREAIITLRFREWNRAAVLL